MKKQFTNLLMVMVAVLAIENLNTSKAASTASMFSGCNSLTSLDLSKFDTSSVTRMQNMFSGCIALTSLGIMKSLP